MDLIADIGATNTRCALIDDGGRIGAPEVFHNDDFASLEAVLHAFLAHRPAAEPPTRAALAIAAPILGDAVQFTNRDWHFSQTRVAREFGLASLFVINDFAAVAWALPALGPDQTHRIGGGEAEPRTPVAVLGPGSGLGVSSIVPAGEGWAVAHGEGGHVTLAATTPREAAIIDLVRARFGHCSAERLLSGPGLVNLYEALAQLEGRQTTEREPAAVTALAAQGDALAGEAMGLFFSLLGNVAGNLALTVGARGGVYIAGGIVPRVLDRLERSGFRDAFEAKGRYRWYMERIPTFVITEPLPAFVGLRALLGYGSRADALRRRD